MKANLFSRRSKNGHADGDKAGNRHKVGSWNNGWHACMLRGTKKLQKKKHKIQSILVPLMEMFMRMPGRKRGVPTILIHTCHSAPVSFYHRDHLSRASLLGFLVQLPCTIPPFIQVNLLLILSYTTPLTPLLRLRSIGNLYRPNHHHVFRSFLLSHQSPAKSQYEEARRQNVRDRQDRSHVFPCRSRPAPDRPCIVNHPPPFSIPALKISPTQPSPSWSFPRQSKRQQPMNRLSGDSAKAGMVTVSCGLQCSQLQGGRVWKDPRQGVMWDTFSRVKWCPGIAVIQ